MVTPEEKAALAEQRCQHDDTAIEDAEHVVWVCVHDDDASGFDDLMATFHDVATASDIGIMHHVLREALARVKERDDSPAGALWDRLVWIVKENAQ